MKLRLPVILLFLCIFALPVQAAEVCIEGSVSERETSSPLAAGEVEGAGNRVDLNLWRLPCESDESKSVILMRITLLSAEFFACGASFIVSQGGVQDSIALRNIEEGSSVCVYIDESATFLMDPYDYSWEQPFDSNQEFSLFYEDGADIWEFKIPAYSPSSSGSQSLSMALEEPTNASSATGVSNIRGWAVSSSGINRLELFINGNFISEIPYGGNRGDVEGAFPDVPDSINSGFGQTFNYGLLGQGEHSMTVRAYANNGELIEKTSLFEVVSFREAFIATEGYPDLSEAQVSLDQDTARITIANVVLEDGSTHDVVLQWRKATQGFEIVEVLEFVVD